MGEAFEHQPLKQFTEKAYLDYSMYVILDRALPHLGDGLKPVQRRIIYAMSELGLSAGAKPKKSARTVGDVLGKFHPHGDVACYEAMVQMAQPFSYRYPLIDGQGNWGSPDDPKSFAAMRYTEARLATHAQLLLEELGQGTVDWVPNFDGTLEEPALLPARLPHVLLNGANGIAVGMATDIPPHNLREVAAACIHLLENPKSTVEDLCRHVQGPDLPTEAEIVTPPEDLVAMYRNGTGSVRMRARYVREGQAIVVTALPYQVSGGRVLSQIAQQMQARKLPMVEDLRDESDHEQPTRLVIVPRSGRVDVDALMDHLFATTDLEHSIRVNLNVIGLDGRPQVMGLRVLIKEWLQFRTATVRRRLEYRLDQVRRRLHVLEGLLAAYLNLDEVIAIIRNEDEPRPVLMERFDLSDIQANAILDMRLRHLARLEEMRIRGEQEELDRERGGLEKTLASARRLKTVVRHELEGDAERYGDERRSPLAVRQPARAFRETELVPSEPVTVVLSRKGWVRAAKGHDLDPARLNFRSGDGFQAAACGRSNGTAVFLDTGGRSYAIPVHGLPSARSLGEPLTGRVDAPDGAGFVGVLMGEGEDRWLLATDVGYGFIATLEALTARNRGGKAVLTVPEGGHVLRPVRVGNPHQARIAVLSSAGRLLLFPAAELPEMARGRGVRLMHIPPAKRRSGDERVVAAMALDAGAALRVDCGRRHLSLKGTELDAYLGERGTRGQLLPRGLRRVQGLIVGD